MLRIIKHLIFRRQNYIALYGTVLIALGTIAAHGQPPDPFNRDPRREEEAKIVKEMLAKQQSEREKKEHEELLKRADSVLELSSELEAALRTNSSLGSADSKKLAEFEKTVRKIRNELGGDDDDAELDGESGDSALKNAGEVIAVLRKSTLQLVEEVKKTTRFSISVAAIRSTNSVLRLVRLLRLRN